MTQETMVRARDLAPGDYVRDIGTGYGATVAVVTLLRSGVCVVRFGCCDTRESTPERWYPVLRESVAHRIGWGPEMLVCYCDDGAHREAFRPA